MEAPSLNVLLPDQLNLSTYASRFQIQSGRMGRTAGIVDLLCLAGDKLLITAIGLQGSLLTWAALHGHSDIEHFNKLCLRGPLIQRHLDIPSNTGLTPNRDRNGQGCEQLDPARYRPF